MNSLTFAKNGRSSRPIAFTEATVLKTTEAAASVASNVATALIVGDFLVAIATRMFRGTGPSGIWS